MNEQLKFSWGHILAFLSLIFISYLTFMGVTYLTDGNFLMATMSMLLIDVLILGCFIGVQILKGTEQKFRNKIILERICILSSPFIFIVLMIPFAHFWTVYGKKDTIVERFSNAITTSKQMFTDYDEYSKTRLDNYDELIQRILRNKKLRPDEYSKFGFDGTDDIIQHKNMNKTLKLQLISKNYDSLRTVAKDWIDRANIGASVWNVFLLGNIKQIDSSIENWHNMLVNFSGTQISNEEFNDYNRIEAFDSNNVTIVSVKKDLSSLNNLYTEQYLPNIYSILICMACYLMLLFPYFLQERHTKNTYKLFGQEKLSGNYLTLKTQKKKVVNNTQIGKDRPPVFDDNNSNTTTPNSNQSDDDFCGPFTL